MFIVNNESKYLKKISLRGLKKKARLKGADVMASVHVEAETQQQKVFPGAKRLSAKYTIFVDLDAHPRMGGDHIVTSISLQSADFRPFLKGIAIDLGEDFRNDDYVTCGSPVNYLTTAIALAIASRSELVISECSDSRFLGERDKIKIELICKLPPELRSNGRQEYPKMYAMVAPEDLAAFFQPKKRRRKKATK